MSLRMFLVIVIAVLAGLVPAGLVPAPALAQEQADDSTGGFVFRADGDLNVASGETVSTAIVIGGDAYVAGTVDDFLMVIDGNTVISGTVTGDVAVISGDLELTEGALITGDVQLVDSDLTRAEGAVVEGSVEEGMGWQFGWFSALFGVYIWVAMTLLVVVAALLFAAIGGRQLTAASDAITSRPGFTILSAVIVTVGIPILAVLAFLTVIGIPVGFGLLLFVLPAFWFLGYIVTGTRVGTAIVGRANRESPEVPWGHPYLAALIGVLLFQLLALIPIVGMLIAIIAGLLGAGALLYTAWHAFRGEHTPVSADRHRPAPTAGTPQPR